MQKPIISIKKLSFNHKERTVININKFELHRGAMYLFTGGTGSGKTTLLNLLLRRENYDSGIIEYEGKEYQIQAKRRKKISAFLTPSDKIDFHIMKGDREPDIVAMSIPTLLRLLKNEW